MAFDLKTNNVLVMFVTFIVSIYRKIEEWKVLVYLFNFYLFIFFFTNSTPNSKSYSEL